VAFLAGPLAWSIDELGSYFLEPKVHAGGTKVPMHVVTAVAFSMIIGGAIAARRALRRPDAGLGGGEERSAERTRFLALGGLVMTGFFFLVIVAETIPKLLLGARE
jgi:hypothetical protein